MISGLNRRFALSTMLTALLATGGLSCTARWSKDAPGIAADSQQPEPPPARRAFAFREADLPVGFPPPGPVGEVIVKTYPSYRMAQVDGAALGRAADQDDMFGPLFRHIQRNDIPMTAPVEMQYRAEPPDTGLDTPANRRAASMAFLYGDQTVGAPGPDPADTRVVVRDAPPLVVLSVSVRGRYNDRNFEAGLAKLESWLAANPTRYRAAGEPRYLGYNSPFVPGFLRLGEVQIPVEAVE
jgi:hypothetical protein